MYSDALNDRDRNSSFTHNWNGAIPLSIRIPMLLEGVTERHRFSFEPLYHRIDPGSLDGLFLSPGADIERDRGMVQFPYGDHWIAIRADGTIEIREAAPD